MGIKLIVFTLVLILLLIALFLFTVAGLLFGAPELLAGSLGIGIAISCIVAGAVIIIPLLILAISILISYFFSSEKHNRKHRKGTDL
ncbi:MAG: hypothetical protein PUE85_06185 [Firmicutes bacterium]|nr:hypothetical protein [Bacillota bacterium]